MERSLGFSLMFGKFIYLMFIIHIVNDTTHRGWSRALRQLDLNLLRVFDAVLQHRNLTRAAEQLAMTQPAVSNAVRRLRDALQDDVIRRHGQGVLPTPKALRLWPVVRGCLAQLDAALDEGAFAPQTSQQVFVLGMADATAARLMPFLAEQMATRAPKASLRVLPLTTRDPREALTRGALDVAVGYFPRVVAALEQGADEAAFYRERLHEDRYVAVMRPDHPLAQPGALTLAAYCQARHLLVSFTGRPVGFVDEALAKLGLSRHVAMTVNQFYTAGRVVTSTDLLAVLPLGFVPMTGMAEQLAVREIPLDLHTVEIDALWHRDTQHLASHVWLRDQLQQAAHNSNL